MKTYRIFTITTILFFTSCLFCTAQERMNTVRLQFEGRRYDSLTLRLRIDIDRTEYVKGYSSDSGYNWEFSYPDSIDYIFSSFSVSGTPDSISLGLRLCLVQGYDTLKINGYYFGRPVSFVKARYLNTDTLHDVPIIRQGAEISVTLISENYEIFTNDKELLSSIKALSLGYGYLLNTFSYEENIQRDMELTKQYPDSRFLIRTLANSISRYNSRADVAKVFKHFSEENKQSYFGQKISQYISRVVELPFNNHILQTWDIGTEQAVIQDSSKYNLVIFSASWCAPCVKMIPLLKEIYQDLGQNLIMTYVSLDEKETAENWQTKMRTHEIPWRSLMALDKSKEVHKESIPYAVLVHPKTMYWESLDVRKDEDKQRLYELLK